LLQDADDLIFRKARLLQVKLPQLNVEKIQLSKPFLFPGGLLRNPRVQSKTPPALLAEAFLG
jgi:hypothetical protein